MQGEGAKERTRSVLPHTVTKKATPRITPNKASTPPCHAGSGLALVRLSSPLSPDHARIVVHALFVDHAHLTQKPRRFCVARGDDGLYALQRLAASLSKLLPVASPSRLDTAGVTRALPACSVDGTKPRA